MKPNSTKPQATARPWQQYNAAIYQAASHAPGASAHICDVISDSKERASEEDILNAALIVQAVNEQDALLAKLAAYEKVAEAMRRAINALENCQEADAEESKLPQWACIVEGKEALAAVDALNAGKEVAK